MIICKSPHLALAAVAFIAAAAWSAPNAEPPPPAAPGTSGAPAAPMKGLPTAEQIMIDSVKALGGTAAIEKIKTVCSTMAMSVQGMTMQMELCWSRAGGRRSKMTTPMGPVEAGSDGKIAWRKELAGYRVLPEAEAKQMNDQASLFMNVLEPQRIAKEKMAGLQTAGKESVDGKECYRVHYSGKEAGNEGDVFYEIASGLPVAFETLKKRPGGEQKSRMIVGDWKEEQGVKFFRTVTVESTQQPGAAVTMTVETLDINTMDDAAFAAPEDVKKLAANPPGAAGAKEIKLEDLTPTQQQSAQQMLDGLKKSGNVEAMKQTVAQIEPSLAYMTADQKPTLQYVLQELKKEIARLGG